MKDWWEDKLYDAECQVAEATPSYLTKNWQMGCSWVLHQNWLFLITPTNGTPLYKVVQIEWARCATTTMEEQTLKETETEEAPQSVNCLPLAQHQADETPLGWVNRKLCTFLQTFDGASLFDQRWKVQCRGTRGVWRSTLAFWQQRYCSDRWGLKDMTGHNNFNPNSLHSRDCKLITLEGMKQRH